MRNQKSRAPLAVAAGTAALLTGALIHLAAQAPAPQAGGRGGGRGGGMTMALFTAADTNKDGALTRDELQGAFDAWFTQWDTAKAGSLTQAQLAAGLGALAPAAPAGGPPPQGPAAAAARTRVYPARPTSTR